jgi:hypothetical protein
LHTRFRKGQSDNPGGRSQKKLHALLADALSKQVFVTVDGELINDVEQKAGVTSPVPKPRRLDAADKEVVLQLVDRIRRQILAEMAVESIEAAGAEKRDCRFRRGHPQRRPSEKAPNDRELAKELHELKRRRETPLPLIECLMSYSLSPPN